MMEKYSRLETAVLLLCDLQEDLLRYNPEIQHSLKQLALLDEIRDLVNGLSTENDMERNT